jgi:hypothetical protein
VTPIYLVQLAGLAGLCLALRARGAPERDLGRFLAVIALLASMWRWDAW